MDENKTLSRYEKNQDMYKDVYLNTKVVDFNNLASLYDDDKDEYNIPEEETEIEVNSDYKTKEYNFEDFLNKAHEERFNDNANRSLDDTFIEKQNEIVELIQSIEQKEKEDNLFYDLLPDLEDETLITDPVDDVKLEETINEEMLINYANSENSDEENSVDLEDTLDELKELADEEEKITKIKSSKLPIIVFSITFVLLIALIIFVVIKLK